MTSLRRSLRCSYAPVTLRLGEVWSGQTLLAVLYQRREQGRPSAWCLAPKASDFKAPAVVRTPRFGATDSRTLCGARGSMPRRGSVPHLGSVASRVALGDGTGYAKIEPDRNGVRVGDLAVVAKPVTWAGRVATVEVVAVPYGDRHILSTQLTATPRCRRELSS